jgi:hypothetical protein
VENLRDETEEIRNRLDEPRIEPELEGEVLNRNRVDGCRDAWRRSGAAWMSFEGMGNDKIASWVVA